MLLRSKMLKTLHVACMNSSAPVPASKNILLMWLLWIWILFRTCHQLFPSATTHLIVDNNNYANCNCVFDHVQATELECALFWASFEGYKILQIPVVFYSHYCLWKESSPEKSERRTFFMHLCCALTNVNCSPDNFVYYVDEFLY